MPIHGYPGNVITANPVAPTSTVATGVWTTEQQLKAVAAGNWPFRIPTQQVSLSARFNSADSTYLNRTFTTPTSTTTWTLSWWIKRSNITSNAQIFSAGGDFIYFGGGSMAVKAVSGAVLETSQVFRDVSAWYHFVVIADTSNATADNRVRLYVNGSQVTAFASRTNPSQNAATVFNANGSVNRIGGTGSTEFLSAYLAEINFIDGQALTPSSFGQTNVETGVWEPIAYTGTYGTNGFYLPFNFDSVSFSADFLVIAGGGSGGGTVVGQQYSGGGGGAGGYRTSVGTSGGGGSAESSLTLSTGTSYTVTVGAGGAGAAGTGNSGSNSVFSSITSTGGGAGGFEGGNGTTGGSGGGGSYTSDIGGSGTANQGYAGGNGASGTSGGGGGAGAIGGNAVAVTSAGNGGVGVASTITGSSVTRGGGGGGGASSSLPFGTGGTGGGGDGSSVAGTAPSAGTANTGGGGGGTAHQYYGGGGNGGSGVIIIKIADTRTATFSSGVTSSLSTAVSGFKIYTVTATSTTSETVTFT